MFYWNFKNSHSLLTFCHNGNGSDLMTFLFSSSVFFFFYVNHHLFLNPSINMADLLFQCFFFYLKYFIFTHLAFKFSSFYLVIPCNTSTLPPISILSLFLIFMLHSKGPVPTYGQYGRLQFLILTPISSLFDSVGTVKSWRDSSLKN